MYVLHGFPAGAEAECVAHDLIPVLNSLEQVDSWTALARTASRPLPAIIQADTGMARLGLAFEEVRSLTENPRRLDGVDLRYVMSHLACAEDQANALNFDQLVRFEAIRTAIPRASAASLANSSECSWAPSSTLTSLVQAPRCTGWRRSLDFRIP